VATRMVRLSLGQEGTKLLEDWLDEIRWECRHGAYSFYSGSLDDSPDDVVSVPASHTETLFIEGSFKRRASFDVSYPKKARARARARARSCSRNSHPSFHRGLCPAGVAPCTPAFPCPNSFRAATHPFGLGNCATPSARGRDAGNSVAQTRRAASLAVGPWNRFQNPLRYRRQISAQARVRKDPCSVPRRAILGLTLRRHSSRRLLSWS
jgi:hypothetical protein